MPISFDSIPAALRTPGVYIEFNNELAGAGSLQQKVVVIGQRLSTGTMVAGVPTRITSESQAVLLAGRGSMLTTMLRASINAGRDTELWAIALDDNTTSTAATATCTIAGTATANGSVYLYIGGQRVVVSVSSGDTAADIAEAIKNKVEADHDLLVNAAFSAGVVTYTAKNNGEAGNTIDIRHNYYDTEAFPGGITCTLSEMTGGANNPDISTALTALGDDWYHWIVMPYTDTSNLTSLKAELDDRWGPMRQLGCRAFAAYRGTHAETATFGNAHNSPHLSVMGTNLAPQPPFVWAAINATVAAASLAIDPARPLQTLVLPGLLAPALAKRWTREEHNTLLTDGIATYRVGSDGTVRIERQITTYQTNSAGLDDASYLDINTPETLERIRYEQRALIAQRYPRHKLAADGTRYGAGQPIVTPVLIIAELMALYREMEARGWVEGADHYKDTIVAEINADDPNRLDVTDQPNLVNQFRVYAQKTQFIL